MKRSVAIHCFLVAILLTGGMVFIAAGAEGPAAIKISENRRYFVDANGKPFFWQGDTEWELFHLLSIADAKALLLERHKQGFNAIQVMATGVYPEWGATKGMKPWDATQQAWLDNNPLTPNETYFKRADEIVAAANEYGMVLVVGVYHARDQDEGRISTQNAKTWAKWLGQRYKHASNIVWSMYPHADASSEPVVRATVQGLLEADGGAHLITMHPDPSPTSSSFLHNEFWLAFNTLQTWSSDFMNYDMVRADYLRLPAKPVVDGEARYEEEDGTTPLETRRAGYWACLAGGFYTYGHRDNWMSPQTWRGWYDSPGAKQIQVMGDLFRSIQWWHLVPDRAVLLDWTTGNAAARSSDGDWILAYLTGNSPVNVKLSSITASDLASAWWVDPRTGARTKIGIFATSRTKEFTPPSGWQDAILFVEKEPR